MNATINPATWASWNLRAQDKQFDTKMQNLLSQLSQFATQTQLALAKLQTALGLSTILNGNALLLGTSLSVVSYVNAAQTTNQTINAASAAQVVANIAVTGAINFTLTLSNVSTGTIVALRIANTSGASRTFTVSATNPSSTSYTVVLSAGTSVPTISSGLSIANGTSWNGIGIANPASSPPQIILIGNIGS